MILISVASLKRRNNADIIDVLHGGNAKMLPEILPSLVSTCISVEFRALRVGNNGQQHECRKLLHVTNGHEYLPHIRRMTYDFFNYGNVFFSH